MLLELRVGNLALVDDLVLRFEAGLTILTGETGAGKSLIAGALSLLTGGKADREAIRQGEEMAHVEGVFDLADRPDLDPVVHTLGVRLAEDRILVLRREMRREGRGRVLINGMVSSLALLEQIGPLLLSVQSQDQQRLLGQSTFAGDFLDGALKLQASRDLVAGNLQRFNALAEKLAARTREEEFARQQLEMWEYQLQELEEAGLDPEEESALTEKIALGRNSRALLEGAGKALETLADGEISARQLLNAAAAALEPAARSSSRLEAVLEMIREAETAAAEAGSDLGWMSWRNGSRFTPRCSASTTAMWAPSWNCRTICGTGLGASATQPRNWRPLPPNWRRPAHSWRTRRSSCAARA
jgi:DNA repair protein RecN (Recombination protein N)